jgi:hypothetical protein
MIPIMEVKRVCLLHVRVDFRKMHDGLLGEAYKLGVSPYDGDMVIFVGRRKDRIKILFSDNNGLWVLYKRFHNGSLSKKFKFLDDPSTTVISPSQVLNLLEGGNSKNQNNY